MGWSGQVMVVFVVVMAIISNGSGEVMAVTSILVYDIYQIYLKPYRMVFDESTCILCGRERGHNANPRDICRCISMTFCKTCAKDDETHSNCKRVLKPPYACPIHGMFRTYNDFLHRLKNLCQICITIAILPLTLILEYLEISQDWVYQFVGVLVAPTVVPIVLSLCWSRLTGFGMTVGAIGGAISGLVVWLIVAALQPNGLYDFFANTSTEKSMLAGNLMSIFSGALIAVAVSLFQNRNESSDRLEITWESTRDIDNPLQPWTEMFAKEMDIKRFNVLVNRPSLADTERKFRMDKIVAYVVGSALTFAMVILWPLATISSGVMDITSFTHWISMVTVYGFAATIFIIVVPVITELYELKSFLRQRNSIGDADIDVSEYHSEHQHQHQHQHQQHQQQHQQQRHQPQPQRLGETGLTEVETTIGVVDICVGHEDLGKSFKEK